METQITTELLKTIYDRVSQYYLAKYGRKLDAVGIDDDGKIKATVWYDGADEDVEYISANELSEDLDVLIEQRKRKEDEERIKRLERQKEDAILKAIRDKENRKAQYLQLKKEFEEDPEQ